MTVPGNSALILMLTLSILVSSAYAVGRIHEWHRHGLKRDEAYRLGYDKASHSMIGMITVDRPPSPPAHRSAHGPLAGRTTRRLTGPARGSANTAHGHRSPAHPHPRQRTAR